MQLTSTSYATRRHLRELIEDEIAEDDPTIVFTEAVEFISRAAADEAIAMALTHDAAIDATDAGEDVQKMLAVVLAGPSEEARRDVEIDLANEVSIPPTGD